MTKLGRTSRGLPIHLINAIHAEVEPKKQLRRKLRENAYPPCPPEKRNAVDALPERSSRIDPRKCAIRECKSKSRRNSLRAEAGVDDDDDDACKVAS